MRQLEQAHRGKYSRIYRINTGRVKSRDEVWHCFKPANTRVRRVSALLVLPLTPILLCPSSFSACGETSESFSSATVRFFCLIFAPCELTCYQRASGRAPSSHPSSRNPSCPMHVFLLFHTSLPTHSLPIGATHRPRGHHPPRSHPRERNDLHRRFRMYVPHSPAFPYYYFLSTMRTAGPQDKQHLETECRKAHVICVVYSIDNPNSFDRIPTYWLPYFRQLGVNVPVILVGNKIDLRGGEVTNEALEAEIIPIMNEFKVCPPSLPSPSYMVVGCGISSGTA